MMDGGWVWYVLPSGLIQTNTRSIHTHWDLPHLWLYQPGPTPARHPTITCGEAPARPSIPSKIEVRTVIDEA